MSNAATYAIATGLKGFQVSELRVRITRRDAGLVWVRTADLLDAGTELVLDASQIQAEPQPEPLLAHRDGLVTFG